MKTNMPNTYSEPERFHQYYEITWKGILSAIYKHTAIQGNVQRFIFKIIIFEESNQIQ